MSTLVSVRRSASTSPDARPFRGFRTRTPVITRALALIGLVSLLSARAFGAPASAGPSFDVADIHVRPHSANAAPYMTGGVLRGGRYDLRNASMMDLISAAYETTPETVVGGPNWIERTRFDIIAKAPNATQPQALRTMLQNLLTERFKLVTHKDTRPIPSFLLTVGSRGPKLKAAAPAAPAGPATAAPAAGAAQPQSISPGECQYGTFPTSEGVPPMATMSCKSVTMEQFAQQLRNTTGNYITARVVDMTSLKEKWDVDLKWTQRNNIALQGKDAVTLFAAVERLGLKLTYDKAPASVLLVDAVNEKPTENPSGIAENLPAPPPAEFDVAAVKIADPNAQMNGRLQPGGRLDFQGITLKNLVQIAWGINSDELLAGAPKWFDATKYSLVARVSASALGAGEGAPIDIDDVRVMLRSLLEERFKLKTHMEDRPVSTYALLAEKPKLQPADPSNRASWISGPAPGAPDPRDKNPILNRLVTVQNMTMTQFAEDLTSIASGYIRLPVVDDTGLTGSYDFVLSFTGVGRLQNQTTRGADGSAGVAAASDPNGALSLFDALQKQVGLKLEERKRPFPVLVIDHVDEQPSDN